MPVVSGLPELVETWGTDACSFLVIVCGPDVTFLPMCFRLHDIVPTAYPNDCLVGVLFEASSSR